MFCNKANDPKSQNTPDTPDFWLANKIFGNNLCAYAFMHLSYQLCYICFTSYHYINHWFVHLLYIFCMMNIVRMWQGNIVLRNISGVTEGVCWVQLHHAREKSCPFKRIQNEIFHLVLPDFNFWPVTEKCYYVSILTGCQNNS